MRGFQIRAVFAAVVFASVLGLVPVYAQSSGDLVNSLKPTAPPAPRLTRSLGPAAVPTVDPKTAAQHRFIENMRRTRSISVEAVGPVTPADRQQVAEIAKSNPAVDLEILFDYNSAVIGPAAVPMLVRLGTALTDPSLKGSVFLINGYTDAAGSAEYNLGLSQRRANAVRRVLIEQFHIAPTSLIAVGFGKEYLKNPHNPLGAENRRVQIVNTNVTAGR